MEGAHPGGGDTVPQRKPHDPIIVPSEEIDPRHRWDRPLPAPGHVQVDFEERVDFRPAGGTCTQRVPDIRNAAFFPAVSITYA